MDRRGRISGQPDVYALRCLALNLKRPRFDAASF
jgi:hypothetical protein